MGKDSCEKAVRMYIYVFIAVATLLFLPLQFFFTQIFKAYHEELNEEGEKGEKGYQQVPNDDEAKTA